MKVSWITSIVARCLQMPLLGVVLIMSACQQNPESSKELIPEKLSVIAELRFLSLPSQRSKSVRYDIIIDNTVTPKLQTHLPVKARVYCFRDCPTSIEPDTAYKAHLFLQKADYPRNPASFNYQLWLDRQGFNYTGKLFANTLTILDADSISLHSRFITWLKTQLDEHDYGSHYLALLTGLRGPITPDDIKVLVNTGTMHLLVVSGLHLGFIFILVFALCRLFLPGSPLWASLFGLSAMLLYAWLAGFSLATQRAFIMAGFAIIWFVLGKRTSPWYGWWLALLLVLVVGQPHIFDAGLWLSFGTVALLLITFTRQNKQLGWIGSLLTSQWYIFPGVCLLQIVFFDRFGFSPLISNLVAIPFIGFVVLPSLLFSCLLLYFMPSLGHLLLDLVDLVFGWFWQGLLWLAGLPWSSLQIAGEKAEYSLLILTLAALSLLHLLPRSTPGRIWVWLFVPLLILPISGRSAKAEIWLLESADNAHLLYIRQNYGLVVSLAQDDPVDINAVRYAILPTLRYFDITHIDWTTLVYKSELRAEDIAALLRSDQTIKSLAPCQQSQEHVQPDIKWHKVNSGCLLTISKGADSLIFVPDIAITDLDTIEPAVNKATFIFSLSTDVLDQLQRIDSDNKKRRCFVSENLSTAPHLSLCNKVTSTDDTGAVRISAYSWTVQDTGSRFNW